MKSTKRILFVLLLAFLFAGCQTTPAETPTPQPEPIATEIPAAEEPTPEIEVEPTAETIPTQVEAISECSDLLMESLGFDVSYQLLADSEDGSGSCQAVSSVYAVMAGDVVTVIDTVEPTLLEQNFLPDESFAADGPLSTARAYRAGDQFCVVTVTGQPQDESLCPADEPIDSCWETLTPEQQILITTISCSIDPQTTMPKTEPERIAFEAGASSAIIPGMIEAGGLVPYVLWAAEGQEMMINLTTNAARSEAVVLEIWGLDGTTFTIESDLATSWQGFLPASQDYYIDLLSSSDHSVQYELEVIILPTSQSEVLPETTPVGFEMVYGFTSQSLPIMLPVEFDSNPETPLVVPFVMEAEETYFEITLDYGEDCHGAGACHYGVLAAIINTTGAPIDTPNIFFDADTAESTTLAKNIPAWFIPSQCGANCSDAMLFFIYDGVQTIIGTQNPDKASLIALANDMIENSVH